jgi:hypothetical protein
LLIQGEKQMKKIATLTLLGLIGSIVMLGSCTGGGSSTTSSSTSSSKPNSSSTSAPSVDDFIAYFNGTEVNEGASLTLSVNEKVASLTAKSLEGDAVTPVFVSSDASVLGVGPTGLLTPLKAGTADITLTNKTISQIFHFTIGTTQSASGALSYASTSYDEKAKILASLEDYAVNNYLTGITMFSNGGYVCYNSRYTPLPREYVTGYGWGTSREGKLTSELSGAAGGHPTYYTIGTTSVVSKANAMDATGSDVSDLAGYISNSYFGTRLNATNDGYEWYPVLAKTGETRPVAIDAQGNAIANPKTNTRWRIHLRDGVKYASGSQNPISSSYNGKEVELADYLTPLKFMLTGWNQQARGAELTTGVAGLNGAAQYFQKTATRSDPTSDDLWDDTLWDQYVGDNIKMGKDDTGNYIEFNLLYPCTPFYAMYYLSSTLYSPLPEAFIKHWGANSLGLAVGSEWTMADTMLATGPYYIDKYSAGDILSLKKNPYYFTTQDNLSDGTIRQVYQIPGFDFKKLDNSALKDNFLAGRIDSYAPNKDTLKDPFNTSTGSGTASGVVWNRYQTKGDANFKINVNSTTQAQWDKYFGTSGTTYPHPSAGSQDYRTRKEYLSDKNFLNFLSFGLDRKSICEARGTTPTQEYFSDNYLIDPETGVSYNSTAVHKAVLANRYNETYGYSVDAAKAALDKAMDDTIVPMAQNGKLKAPGSGAAGTKNNPWYVPINMNWMNPTDTTDYSDVFDSINKIFSEEIEENYGGNYKLVINQIAGTSDYNQVYNIMKQGEFDLGFGAISGNDLDPLGFFEVLRSNNSSTFTVNWGADTSLTSPDIVYDGKTWSFDGLWKAGTSGAAVAADGSLGRIENVSTAKVSSSGIPYESINSSDETVTYSISFKTLVQGGATNIQLAMSTDDAATMEALGATAGNNYTISLVIPAKFNTTGATGATTDVTTIAITVTFNLSFADGTSSKQISTLTLQTYKGASA